MKKSLRVVGILASAALVACGGGGSGGGDTLPRKLKTTQYEGQVIKGLVANAIVSIKGLDNKKTLYELATGVTEGKGQFSIAVKSNYKGPKDKLVPKLVTCFCGDGDS